MHIAYLTPEYPHKKIVNGGGMGTSIKNLVHALVDNGHQVTIFVYGQQHDEVFEEKGIYFHLIAQKKYSLGGFYFYRKHIENYIRINSNGIDLIEAPDWTGITAFMNLKLPLVIRFHGSDTYFCHIEGRPQKWKNRFFEKNAVNKAKAFIAPTQFAGKVSMDLFNLPLDKLSVISYGLQMEDFVNKNPMEYTAYNLLNIGTLIRKKGVFQLVEIFNAIVKQYPSTTLTLIGADSPDVKTGNNSTWELMKERMTEAALENTTYLGKIPYSEVQENIKCAHICVFPSLAETLGMVTIESMALHKAVVNTNLGWAKDLIIHGEDGYMYHPDDIKSYVNTIIELFENRNEVYRLGNNAANNMKSKFDIKKIANKNSAFYKSILELK